jgi:hypothetical protein
MPQRGFYDPFARRWIGTVARGDERIRSYRSQTLLIASRDGQMRSTVPERGNARRSDPFGGPGDQDHFTLYVHRRALT